MAQTLLNINQYGATYGGASNAYQFYLVVTLNSQSTANNTSNITVTHSANGRNGWGYSGFSTPTSTITVGGTQRVSSTVAGIPTNGASVTLSTWTGNVTHNNDGTLSLAVSATYNPNTTGYSYVPRTNTLSGTITLPTIPRASDVSVSNYTISNTTGSISATITSRANFYHRWRWKVGSGSWSGWNNKGLIATTSSTVTVSNSNLLSRMPSDKSATFTIEVATYSDSSYSTHVGTKSASATLTVTIKPSVSLGNIAINTSPISGYAVAGYSTVKATWSATPGSGASNGTTYFSISTGSVTASSSTASSGTVTSTTIPGSASNYTLTITAYTVDSRGLRSDNVSKSITVYGYQPPTATLSAYRVANSTSTAEDGAGVYVYVTFSGAVRSTVNSQNSIQSTTCTYSGSISGTATNGQHIALADSQSATFTLTVRDKVTSSTAIVSVAPALYPLDLYDNGSGTVGVGFGTTAEGNTLRSALWHNIFESRIQAPVHTSAGTSGLGNQTGYAVIATIKVLQTYKDTPIEFTVTKRNMNRPCRLVVKFTNVNSTDPEISQFLADGYLSGVFWLNKSTTSTFQLIAYHSAWEGICITDTQTSTGMWAGISVDYTASFLSTLPSTAITPTAIGVPYADGAGNDSYGNVLNMGVTMTFIKSFATTDGRYYTRTMTFNVNERFPFLCLKADQTRGYAPVGLTYNYTNGTVYSSDTSITYNTSTKVLTVDNGQAAWAAPMLICPYGYIT